MGTGVQRLMDTPKITGALISSTGAATFRKRTTTTDDHDYFRQLTLSSGVMERARSTSGASNAPSPYSRTATIIGSS